jgi:hypothetical protein
MAFQMRRKSIILMCILLMLSANSMAFQLSPSSIMEPEGTTIDLQVTVEPGDWVMVDSNWINQCELAGVANAEWVAVMMFDFVNGTAAFGNGPSDRDLHLTFLGSPRDDTYRWFQCETGSQAPSSLKYWTSFDIVLNTDDLEEGTETATLNLVDAESSMVVDSIAITIEDNASGPFSDWVVTVTDVMPTELSTEETISITAVGDRITNPDYVYAGGWEVVFLLSTNPTITLNDTPLATRSFSDFSFSFNETWMGTLGVQPGTYWVGACSTVPDDDPSNDCSMGVEITVTGNYPDLAVIFLDGDPRSVIQGDDLDVFTQIQNIGGVTSEPSTARVYLSLDNIISESDPTIATASIGSLEPLQIWGAEGPVPVDVDPGVYYLAVCADPVMNEENQANNCGLGPRITVEEAMGDGCSSQPIACDSLISGNLNGDDCTAGPRGSNRYAEKFTFEGMTGDRLFLDANWSSSLDGFLLLQGPNGLTVAQNDNGSGTANSHIEYELKQNGTFTLWATSYPGAAMGSFELSLKCDSPPGPDLTLDTPSIGEGTLVPGQNMLVSTRLRNIGDAGSDSTRLRYVLSSNSVIDLTDTQLGSDGSAGLAAGSSRAAQRGLIAPSTPGAYYLGVCADVVPGEASLSNNCSAGRRINVNPRPACTARQMACGSFMSGSLSVADCTSSPRGNGFLAERLDIDLSSGREVVIDGDFDGLDGYLFLTDPAGEVVAQNDDNEPGGLDGSRIEYKAAQSGVHQLWVTSFERNDTGSFGVDLLCGASSAPDLVASQVSLDKSNPSAGTSIEISGTVRNSGNTSAAATTVNVMLSANGAITPTDEIIGTVELASLGAGSSTSVQSSAQAPAEPGNYWLGLCVVPVTGETLVENNCSVLAAPEVEAGVQSAGDKSKPQAGEEDSGTLLVVSSGNSCSNGTLTCGGSVNGTLGAADCDVSPRGTGYATDPITFTANQGDTVSLNSQWTGVDGYLYLEDPVGGIIGENDDSTGAGESYIELVLERSGTYTVWPTAFQQGAGGSYQVNLECNNPQAPDLEIDKPQLSATTLRSGQSLNIRTETRNKGGFTAGPGVVDFILASNPELSGGDKILRSTDVPQLAGGASSTEETDVAITATAGTYYVGTCVNLDADETDTDNNCEVAGPITIEATGEPIEINSGLNDAWYNPATSGQGFFINIFPDNNLVFLSWFTFDTTRPPGSVAYQLGDPGHRWLTAQGTYDLGVADLSIFLTSGGIFDNGAPAATTDPTPYGTMTLTFSDCNNGLVEYNLPSLNESGSIAITRVSAENVAACEASLGALDSSVASSGKGERYGIEANGSVSRIEAEGDNSNGFNYNSSLNDAWFNFATNGQGFFFNIFPDSEFVFMSWFTYDLSRPAANTPFNLGEPGHRWLTAQGPFDGDTANLKVYETTGGIFNQGSLPPSNTVEIGSLTARFEDCNSGLISYEIDSVNRQDDVPIQRLAPDTIPACEAKSSGGAGPGTGAGSGGDSGASTAGVTPSGKPTLENLCNGSVDWEFNWPDVEGASHYLFELYRNDSLVNAPRVKDVASNSEYSYAGKESSIEKQHLDNWHWRYRPVMGFGVKTRVTWSKDFYFNVKSPDNPCLN